MNHVAAWVIYPATAANAEAILRINLMAFEGNRADPVKALELFRRRLHPDSEYYYFVVEHFGELVGYIVWQIHGGVARKVPVVELEQLAVDPVGQGYRLSHALITDTMELMLERVANDSRTPVEKVRFVVWHYINNYVAANLYSKHFPERAGERHLYAEGGEAKDKHEVMLAVEKSVPAVP